MAKGILYRTRFAVGNGACRTAPDTLRVAAAQVANIGQTGVWVKSDGVKWTGFYAVPTAIAQLAVYKDCLSLRVFVKSASWADLYAWCTSALPASLGFIDAQWF